MNAKLTGKTVQSITQIRNKSHFRFTKSRLVVRSSLFIIIVALTSSCSSPAKKLQNQAEHYGLKEIVIKANNYSIKSYYSERFEKKNKNDLVFVYLEGDGRPWSKRLGPNNDPNTHKSVVLPLLAKTKEQSIYLSRPCYGFSPMPKNCNPQWWTSHRYSKQVVEEMDEALRQLKQFLNIKKMVLVGHSGGGTLAMLLAKSRADEKDIVAIITLAGNLDHKAWTDHFNYLPLTGSLNPVEEPQLSPLIIQWHFAGKKDKTMPLQLTKKATKKNNHAKVIVKEKFDHDCCWQTIWEETVVDIKKAIDLNTKKNPL